MIKKQYIAPHLTSVEFRTERGYATSDIALVNTMAEATNRFIEDRTNEGQLWTENFNTESSIEDRHTGNTISSSSWLTNDGENTSYF